MTTSDLEFIHATYSSLLQEPAGTFFFRGKVTERLFTALLFRNTTMNQKNAAHYDHGKGDDGDGTGAGEKNKTKTDINK